MEDDHPECAYVSGFTMEEDEIIFEHAWCATESGDVIDLVLDHPEKCHYHGIAFSSKEMVEALRTGSVNGVATKDDVLFYFALKTAQE